VNENWGQVNDLQRISSANCGAIWTQNFAYDTFGNITKTGSSAFIPGYSPTQNQFTSIPGRTVSYDGNGNLLTDNLNTYTWDVYGHTSTVSTGSTTVSATYDGLGRMVENNAGGSYTEFIYGPTGKKLATASGQTLIKAFVALPAGAKAIYNASGVLSYYRHSDWLGSSRLTSTASRALYSSTAYAPFGEKFGTAGTADASFTGQDQDTVSSLYDFPARRQSPSQGRWISPDPAGRGAVMLANPQSWNRYAYVSNNPLSLIDPLGLEDCASDDDDDNNCNGDNDNGSDDNSGSPNTCDAACELQQQISQAEQQDLYALPDATCANAVDGGTGTAAVTISANQTLDPGSADLYNAYVPGGSLGSISTADIGSGHIAVETFGNVMGSDIYVNSNPSGGFLSIGNWPAVDSTGAPVIVQIGVPGYGPQASRAIVLAHDLAHAANNAGLQTAVVPDAGDSTMSLQNSAAIGNACFPQGDLGGNSGPGDQGPTDVPAIAKPRRLGPF
jgi:RHS repeat-associated protein